jgi:hypothetical protein
MTEIRRRLIRILQRAFSGEKTVGYAYRGHWRSVRDPEERARIRAVEDEERMTRIHLATSARVAYDRSLSLQKA